MDVEHRPGPANDHLLQMTGDSQETLASYVGRHEQLDLSDANFQMKLDQIKDQIKTEIRKEYKIKDAAERMKKVARDKKTLNDVNSMIRKANNKLHDLQQELNELNAHQIVSATSEPGTPTSSASGNEPMSPENTLASFGQSNSKITALERQLAIENKVKQGAEGLLQLYKDSDRKMYQEAQQMLLDSKNKIEVIRMEILKTQMEEGSSPDQEAPENGIDAGFRRGSRAAELKMSPIEFRIEELRHHHKIEAAIVDGFRNAVKLYGHTDRKAVDKAQKGLTESSYRLEILQEALKRRVMELPPDSEKYREIKQEIDTGKSLSYSTLPKPAALTGRLEVRLIGCQDLLENIPNRKPQVASNSNEGRSLIRPSFHSRVSTKGSNSRSGDELTNEVMACLRLDNQEVGHTYHRPISPQCWNQTITVELDKSRELEISIQWKDYRSLSALKFLRLEDFLTTSQKHSMCLALEPQGTLFAEITFFNPSIERRTKLKRQRRIFHKQKGINFLRPNQMNINVATWGRLMKRHVPNTPGSGPPEGFSTPQAPPAAKRGSLRDLQFESSPLPGGQQKGRSLDLDPEVPKDHNVKQEPEHEVKDAMSAFDFLGLNSSGSPTSERAPHTAPRQDCNGSI